MLKKLILLFVLTSFLIFINPVNASTDNKELKVVDEHLFNDEQEVEPEEEEHKKQRMTNIREFLTRTTRIPSF